MIICRLYGRLGNQMFQIAATISHALDLNTTWKIPPHSINSNYWPTYFDHLPKHIYPINIPTYNEPTFQYRPIPMVESMCLNGYFQSELYFKKNFDFVLDQLFPAHKFGTDSRVAIHVRRGDYLHFADKHPPLPMAYYEAAMSHFPAETKYLIFSDDAEWCKSHFLGPKFDFMEAGDPKHDLLKMADCAGFIIANSTFSWWGAYINQTGKTVISPTAEKWFGPGNKHLDTSTIIPESWTKINF